MINKNNKIKIQKVNDFVKKDENRKWDFSIDKKKKLGNIKIETKKEERIVKKIEKNDRKEYGKMEPENWRYIMLFGLIIIPFIYLSWTLFKVQILEHSKYKIIRDRQYEMLPQSLENRGIIYAENRNGELTPLASNKKEYKLVLSPKDLDQKYLSIIFKLLNNITKTDEQEFLQKAKKQKDSYEEIKDLTEEEAIKIKNLKINGVNVKELENRNYPLANVGSQVIGFVGDGDGGVKGRYGLEKYYNDILQKIGQSKTSFFAALFRDLDNGNINNKHTADNSLSIVTTLEPNVMTFLNKELQDIEDKWRADTVAGIVMNTETGEIIAMDSVPNFNPNDFKNASTKSFNNPNVQGVFELGSIMKPITVAGGIENKLINPNTIYRDTGSLNIDGFTIKNYDEKAHGDTTIQTALSKSLNLGMIYIMRLMGFEKFRQNILNFKLAEETGIDLPGEVSNQVNNIYGKTEVNYATVSFGQGIATSPISMLRALNTIANNGKLVNPHLLKKQVDENDNFLDILFNNKNESAISTDTAQTVKSMMVKNLDDFAGGKYKDGKYKMGVKTGTGQIAKPGGGYYTDKTLHSYYAFFPERNTKFSVLIFQVNPKLGESSSITLTEPMQKIKDFLVSYYTVPPDR